MPPPPPQIKLIKVSLQNYERLRRFGYAGESINTALDRVLVIAEPAERS
jgi:hypothetical protein